MNSKGVLSVSAMPMVHPAADLFPMLSKAELQQLSDDIKENGQREPIVMFKGQILDGRNRWRACELAGVAPVTREWSDADASPWLFVWSLNVRRRHLKAGTQAALWLRCQKADAAWRAEVEKQREEANRKRREAARGNDNASKGRKGRSENSAASHDAALNAAEKPKKGAPTKAAAEAAGVSTATIERARELEAKAPDLFEAVCSGRTELGAAKKELTRRERERELAEAKQRVREEQLASVADLRHCSAADLFAGVGNLDAIITDPPYPREYLPLYGELAQQAARALRPGGVLAVMCGESYLPEIFALMAPHIPYRWTLAYLTPGGQATQLWDRKVNTFWKPILVFGGADEWLGDVIRSDVNDNDKRFHGWGQSESGMGRLVEALTKPGQTVCDPFMGAGTTGVASVALARRFVGCDIDAAHVETARGRIAASIDAMKARP